MGATIAAGLAGMITIIQEARTPAITIITATIHRIPMTPTLMTAAAEDVIPAVAGVVMEGAGAEEGIDLGSRVRFGIDFP